jgi:hypothetical protein
MTSFAGLGNANTARFGRRAGNADALIATAFGLFAAIPAVIWYNHFVYQIRNLGGQLDDLQTEILATVEERTRSNGDHHARRQDADDAGRDQHDPVHRYRSRLAHHLSW